VADAFADVPAAGEANLANTPIATEQLAKLATGTGQALNRLRRKTGLQENFAQFQAGKGRIGGGFEDHRVASC
jgi:hypothetical protein